jgi:hypothetical protein
VEYLLQKLKLQFEFLHPPKSLLAVFIEFTDVQDVPLYSSVAPVGALEYHHQMLNQLFEYQLLLKQVLLYLNFQVMLSNYYHHILLLHLYQLHHHHQKLKLLFVYQHLQVDILQYLKH